DEQHEQGGRETEVDAHPTVQPTVQPGLPLELPAPLAEILQGARRRVGALRKTTAKIAEVVDNGFAQPQPGAALAGEERLDLLVEVLAQDLAAFEGGGGQGAE